MDAKPIAIGTVIRIPTRMAIPFFGALVRLPASVRENHLSLVRLSGFPIEPGIFGNKADEWANLVCFLN